MGKYNLWLNRFFDQDPFNEKGILEWENLKKCSLHGSTSEWRNFLIRLDKQGHTININSTHATNSLSSTNLRRYLRHVVDLPQALLAKITINAEVDNEATNIFSVNKISGGFFHTDEGLQILPLLDKYSTHLNNEKKKNPSELLNEKIDVIDLFKLSPDRESFIHFLVNNEDTLAKHRDKFTPRIALTEGSKVVKIIYEKMNDIKNDTFYKAMKVDQLLGKYESYLLDQENKCDGKDKLAKFNEKLAGIKKLRKLFRNIHSVDDAKECLQKFITESNRKNEYGKILRHEISAHRNTGLFALGKSRGGKLFDDIAKILPEINQPLPTKKPKM